MQYKLDLSQAPTDPEEFRKWVEEQAIEAPDAKEYDNLKNLNQKRNAELADAKRKLAEKLDEKEKAELAEKEEKERLLQENADLKAVVRVSTYTAKLLDAGLDSESAAELAKSLPPEVPDSVFERIKSHNAAQYQKIQNELLAKQDSLAAGNPPAPPDPDDEVVKQFKAAMKI